MAGWLSRATEAFRNQPPPAPEPYEVACDCGGRVIGVRNRIAQKPPCPSCGRLVFVLPANVYPVSVKLASKKATPKPKAAPPSAIVVKESKSSAKTRTSVDKPESIERDRPTGIAIESNESWLTPFRLAMTAILVICSLTAWGLFHRHRIETAKAIVAKATEIGLQALQSQDFITAARELERARDAVDLLKRTDPESQLVRRLCREAIAARGLAHESLFDLIHTSMADLKPGDADAKQFDGLYRDSWVLFDVPVLIPEDASQPCTLDMPIFHRQLAIRIEVDFAALREAVRQSPKDEPARVIFAAQLERLAPAAKGRPEAVLTLKGESAFLWTYLDNYTAVGYREDDADELKATRAVLDRQLEVTQEMK